MMKALHAGAGRQDEHDDATNTMKKTSMKAVSSPRRGLRVRHRLAVGLCALAALAGSAACTTTKAAPPLERPALEVPPPPPRVVVPQPPPRPPLEPVQHLAPDEPAIPPRPRPQPREPQKTEPKPEDPKPAEPTPPEAAPPVLRMPETTNDAQLSKQIEDSIVRSKAMLAKIDYGPLNKAARQAYEDSKLFAQQAEDALKAKNLAFAKELADKAERLAKELQGR